MIFDSEIDKENAKFWCVFAGKTYDALQANVKQISKNDKQGITNAKAAIMAASIDKQSKNKHYRKNVNEEDDARSVKVLDQNAIDQYQKSHPNASFDEILKALEAKHAYTQDVQTPSEAAAHAKAKEIATQINQGETDFRSFGQKFKDECKEFFVDQKLCLALAGMFPAGGVAAANLEAAATGTTSLLATGTKTLAKATFVSAPTTVASAAISHPEATAAIVGAYEARSRYKQWAKEHPDAADKLEKFGSWIAGIGASIGTFVLENPLTAAGACALAYGLFKTRDKWIPYVKGLAYKAFNDNYLACCKFKADGDDYSYEYRMDKGQWVLLNGSSIASKEDRNSFLQTNFAKKFKTRCNEAVKLFYDNPAFAQSIMQMGDGNSAKLIGLLQKNKSRIEKTFYA